jgi:hypothetical protein
MSGQRFNFAFRVMGEVFGLVLILYGFLLPEADAGWLVEERIYKRTGKKELVSVRAIEKEPNQGKFEVLGETPEAISEWSKPDDTWVYREILVAQSELSEAAREFFQSESWFVGALHSWPDAEVRTLVDQGDPRNRIDLTIVGDGYTKGQKSRFFQDAKRISKGLFDHPSFRSYLPVFNVHAVFVPSKESGISDMQRKNTALGLYRQPAGSKRAIRVGKPWAARRATRLAPDSDYPILLANDNYYGGLGGKYAITTRSPRSGLMVLRHELGHNFGNVGEEYDGGYVYSGANHSSRPRLPWDHWLSPGASLHEIQYLAGEYVWHPLRDGPFSFMVNFSRSSHSGWMEALGGDTMRGHHFRMDISYVGWSGAEEVEIRLNNQRIIPDGKYTEDRGFLRFPAQGERVSLKEGEFRVSIEERIPDGDNVLAYVKAYAIPDETPKQRGHVAGYATYDYRGRHVGYRPTFETCLMRDMKSPEFCSVDKENMWVRFLKRISLLDELWITPWSKDPSKIKIHAKTPQLRHLRFRWFKKDQQGDYQDLGYPEDQSQILVSKAQLGESFRVQIQLETPEVRAETRDFFVEKSFRLSL